jgi:hypothetical protein
MQGPEQLITLHLQLLERRGIHSRLGSGIIRFPTGSGEPLT